MGTRGIALRPLVESDEKSFKAAVAEFRETDPDDTFAFHFDCGTQFAAYVKLLDGWTRGEGLPPAFVPNTFLVAVVDGVIVGRVSIRHVLNDFLLRLGGHVGYAVIPSRRRLGYATELLRQTLPLARRLGIERVLLTCDEDNIGSRKVIEANGGVLENAVHGPGLRVPKLRYWIGLPSTYRKSGE
jgi:predicted acetyltransferase